MYLVQNMTLIPQTKTRGCWFASAQMLINWRRETRQATEGAIWDPQEDPASRDLWEVNRGIINPQIIGFAKRLGLEAIPPQSPTESILMFWLTHYGPLWVNGDYHIVVIAGIRNEGSGEAEVLVYNPWPVNTGGKEWLSLSGWYIGDTNSSRDTSADVEAVFLHCPAT